MFNKCINERRNNPEILQYYVKILFNQSTILNGNFTAEFIAYAQRLSFYIY